MHKARAFFYVCMGLFLLALSFHLGQVTAQAQGGAVIEGGNIGFVQAGSFPRATACVNRIFRWMGESGGPPNIYPPVPVPGTERIVSTDPFQTVLLENGDWLKFDGTQWVVIGNLAGGPTPATRETFGALKARYRATPGGAQPMPRDR